jgi:ParB family chromosome partitioning protein
MRHDRHYVDELARRMGEGIGRMIRITAISSNQDQPRTNLGNLDDLKSSIHAHGVLEPLLVRRLQGGTYELVSGERRFHAAMAVGLTEVPCIELTVTDEQALEIALIENLQRKDLTAFEEAEGYQTLIHKYQYTHQQVAEAVSRSRVTVTESLRLLTIPSEVRDKCRHADINAKSVLLEIAKAGDEEAMLSLIQQVVEERLDRAALRKLRAGDEDATELSADGEPGGKLRRPFRFQFRNPDKTVSLSLSFRTDSEPEPRQVIEVLRAMIQDIEAQLEDENQE